MSCRRTVAAAGAVLAIVILAGSCHSDRSASPDPSALIRDGFHDDGNAFFYWLPPILHQQAPVEQMLSQQLNPRVTVTNLCTGEVVRTFSGSEVQLGDGHYQANWHTTSDSLDTTCTYRLTVSTGLREMGIADIDVVDGGRELRSVNTGEFIPLLDDRTLPIKFFIGVGSQCERADSDCGEGTVQPGDAATIVTTQGQAGVFIPAGAVDQPVTIIIESSDERPCIPGLTLPMYPGATGRIGNSCYDFHTEPPLDEIHASGKFNTNVTVGICVDVSNLDHATQELLQIFQFHLGAEPPIRALNNVPAPFLACDRGSPLQLGSRRSMMWEGLAARLRSLLQAVAAPVLPRPLHASSMVALDMGTGGETNAFSRFTWALPTLVELNFDQAPDVQSIPPGAVLNNLYSRVGVTFSRTNTLGSCPGSGVYANDFGPLGFSSGQNNISVCPLGGPADFSALGEGAIEASFTVPAAEVCITATPTGFHVPLPSGGVAYIEALDAAGTVVGRTESTTERVPQQLCVQATGIRAARFAGKDAAFAIFDNLRWAR